MTGDAGAVRRVLFLITTSDVGGTESFLYNLATGVDRTCYEPRVISLCPPGKTGERIAAAGVPVDTLAMAARARPWELAIGAVRLARYLDRHRIDIVQGLLYRANLLAAVAARLTRRRPVVVAGQRSLQAMTGRRADWGVRLTRGLCDHVVAVSEAVKATMIAREGIAPERVTVIGNAVDARRFHVGGREEARQKLGVADDALIVGGVGRFAANKGFHDLIAAVAHARALGADLELLLAGDGDERPRLEEQARQLGIAERVRFLGMRRDLDEIYPAFDVFALPSHEEGSPNALLEAMACGCAVVATQVGGVPEIVADERSGLLVPPQEPRRLGAALHRLAADRDLRRRLGETARARIDEAFTLERMVRRHEELYDRLLTGRALRRGAPAPPARS